MNIWILSDCEPLPGENNPRLMRAGLIAEALAKQGHTVTWFSSTFIHGSKTYLHNTDTILPILPDAACEAPGTLILLHSPIKYRRNTSLTRLLYHSILAKKFSAKAAKLPTPDLIFSSWPAMHFSAASTKYGKKHGIPVILDVRDLWPDIFYRALPKPLRGIGKIGIAPYERLTHRAFSAATALTAIVPSHLQWALIKADRNKQPLDRIFFISHKHTPLSDDDAAKMKIYWANLGVTDQTFNLAFFGTLSQMSFDLDTVIEGFHNLSRTHPHMRLVLCGAGDGEEHYRSLASGNSAIIFPGWSNQSQIESLLSMSKIGLYPMRNLPDFIDSITNKMVGYMAASLPILSSLTGFSKEYIWRFDIGMNYTEGNPHSFSQAVEELSSEPKRTQRAKNARARFEADFDADKVNNDLIEYFAEVINHYTTTPPTPGT